MAAAGASGASARPRSSPGCRSTGIRTCSARASGRGAAGGGTVDLSGATAYAEKNWGPALHRALVVGPGPGLPGRRRLRGVRGRAVALACGGAPTRSSCASRTACCGWRRRWRGCDRGGRRPGWRIRGPLARWAVEIEGAAAGAPAVLPVPGSRAERARRATASHHHLAGRMRRARAGGGGGRCLRGESGRRSARARGAAGALAQLTPRAPPPPPAAPPPSAAPRPRAARTARSPSTAPAAAPARTGRPARRAPR